MAIDLQKLEQEFDALINDPNFVTDFEKWLEARRSSQHNAKPLVSCRYFFVTTSGKEPNNSFAINTFDVKTKDGKFPTIAQCVEYSKNKYTSQRETILVAISEIQETDWEHFVSAQ